MKGSLVDRTDCEPLMFAKVKVHGTTDSTYTDREGCFTLDLPSDPSEQRYCLIVEYVGFERYTYRIKEKDLKRARMHRLKRYRFARHVAEATIKVLKERLVVLR